MTLAPSDDLAAVEGLGGTGIVRRTAANTWSAGTAVNLATEVAGNLPFPILAAGQVRVLRPTGVVTEHGLRLLVVAVVLEM